LAKHVCVVGAGLAGGIAATELVRRGFAVTLIEEGTSPAPLQPSDERWEGNDLQAVFTRGRGIGGSANFWHGGLITLDRSDVEGSASFGTGTKWPMAYADLSRHYEAATALMSGGELDLRQLEDTPSSVEGLALAPDLFRFKPLFFPATPYSPASAIERAIGHGLTLRSGWRARRVRVGANGVATDVVIAHAGTGAEDVVQADAVILAAGGIGSPKLLLQSDLGPAADLRLPIGQRLIDHPTGFVFKARLRRRMDLRALFGVRPSPGLHYRRRYGATLAPSRLAEADGRNHVLYLRPAFSLRSPAGYAALKQRLVAYKGTGLKAADLVRLVAHADMLAEAANFKFGLVTNVRYVAGFVFAEQLDPEANAIEPDGRGGFRVRWSISKPDADSLRRFLGCFTEAHAQLFDRVVTFDGLLGSGAHHSGGCRMGHSHADGVVDGGLRVFGTTNLYVADGSVLGTSGYANTGLTIAALALRCVEAIAGAGSVSDVRAPSPAPVPSFPLATARSVASMTPGGQPEQTR
jgi:choline dehydrogenase-like flavoprotein